MDRSLQCQGQHSLTEQRGREGQLHRSVSHARQEPYETFLSRTIGNQRAVGALAEVSQEQRPGDSPAAPHFDQRAPVIVQHSSPPTIQRKLVIGDANDPLEEEADRVADEVMRMEHSSPVTLSTSSSVQRKCARCEEEEEEQATRLQRKQDATSAGHEAVEAPPIVHEVLQSPGEPLDAATRAFFEPRFGRDFGDVRIHTDARARESARAISAQAYTVGTHIAIGDNRTTDQKVIAHELAHVVQQAHKSHKSSSTGNRRNVYRQYAGMTKAEVLAWEKHEARILAWEKQMVAEFGRENEGYAASLKTSRDTLHELWDKSVKFVDKYDKHIREVLYRYELCHRRHVGTLAQVNKEADEKQFWVKVVTSVGTDLGFGKLLDALGKVSEKAQGLGWVAAQPLKEKVSSAIEMKVSRASVLADVEPALQKINALEGFRAFTELLLSIPGAILSFNKPIDLSSQLAIECEKWAGGRGTMNLSEVQTLRAHVKLRGDRSSEIVTYTEGAIRVVDQMCAREPILPSGKRIEQDIWIPWIAHQKEEKGFWEFCEPVVQNQTIHERFLEIDLVTEQGKHFRGQGIRLLGCEWDWVLNFHSDYGRCLVGMAKGEMINVREYWRTVFLM